LTNILKSAQQYDAELGISADILR